MATLIDMARRMRELQSNKDSLETELKGINEELDILRLKEIPEAMAEEDIRTITIDGIGRVQLAVDAYVSIMPDQKEAAYAWLTENGYEVMIQPYIQPSTLKAAAKENMKQGGMWPEELFKIQPFTRASIVTIKTKGE